MRARERIRSYAHRTPVLRSTYLDERCGAELFFKCENFQKVGAFKFRGACNAVLCLGAEELERGVVTHSSGNHAQALALAARIRGTRATIVMPENAARIKVEAVRDYGAQVVFCPASHAAREQATERLVRRTGASLIHPFDDARVIAGQGTAALELLEEVPGLDLLIAPVGGGGLLGGTVLAAASRAERPRVVGAEPSGADDARRSLESGTLQASIDPQTIADGLRTSLGKLTFALIRDGVDAIVTADDAATVEAMRTVWMRMKIVIEPSAAVPVAVLLGGELELTGRRVGVILSGGNVDLDALPW